MPTKVILDTDIGSDIDDAICLAYLLAQPECDLLGVTTVSGESHERAKLVSALCHAAGKPDIPIYPGIEKPFLVLQKQPKVPQAAMLERWTHRSEFPKYEAIDFLRQTIRQHPHEITLLAIGPMTNIAILFATDPEIAGLLKGLVMMVGAFNPQREYDLEWNAVCDPHAIARVYHTKVAVHRSVGLDVTTQVFMAADEVRQRFSTGLLRPVLDFAEVWFKERSVITFHDPLAAATIFDPDICGFKYGRVHVELENHPQLGMTHWEETARGSHEVALTVDKERFFKHYFGVFG
jgi:purine nucleosidase